MEFIFLVALILFALLIAFNIENHQSTKKREQIDVQINKLGFPLTRVIKDDTFVAFGISEPERKIAIIDTDSTQVLRYEDILGVDLVVNGETVISRSLSSMIGATAITGPVGALAADQKVKQKNVTIYVDIQTRLLDNPNIRIQPLTQSSANEIVGIIKIILDRIEQEETSKLLIADELIKLADLRDKGILTEEEFQAQKAKLLRGICKTLCYIL